MTGRDAISAALRLIGVLAPGESLDATEATDGLASLNRMLGTWSNQKLLIPRVVREEFSLVAGTQSYTMGSGATFNTTRPVGLEDATIEDQSSSPAIEYVLDVLTPKEWAAISVKETGNSIPSKIYLDPSSPDATVYLWPKPSSSLKVVLYSLKPITELALDDDIELPPGYEDAIVLCGARRLAPEYGKVLNPDVGQQAIDALGWLKTVNHRPHYLKGDPALVGPGRFNIQTGGYD